MATTLHQKSEAHVFKKVSSNYAMAQAAPSWLNLNFMEEVLKSSENDSTIRVVDVLSKPATAKGDNYTSDMYRVNVEYSRKNKNNRQVVEKVSLIVKIAPTAEGMKREMIEKSSLFSTEIKMMTTALTKMNNLLEIIKEHRLGAKILYSRMEFPSTLVLEDLANLGFRMACRQSGLDLAHSLIAVEGLAKFHASSVALCEKEPKYKDEFQIGILNKNKPKELSMFFTMSTKALGDEMANWPEFDKTYSEKLLKLHTTIYDKGVVAAERRDNEFCVINHGDCWVNNMMFRYDDNGKPMDHIFVDFQLSFYSSPALDLLYFFSTSLNEDVFYNCKDQILSRYLEKLKSIMSRLGCKTQPPTMEALKKSMDERILYGMIASITVLPLMLIDSKDASDLEELMNRKGDNNAEGEIALGTNAQIKNPLFRKVLHRRMPIYDAKGLLES